MKTLRKIVLAQLYILVHENESILSGLSVEEKLAALKKNFCELDSSSSHKFSKHLVIHLPEN